MSQTILHVTFINGDTKTIEYDGDTLLEATKLLDKEAKVTPLAAVKIRTLDDSGKIVFDKNFSYVPEEEVGMGDVDDSK
jgi:hypothetical protein